MEKDKERVKTVEVPATKTLTPWKVFMGCLSGGVVIGYTLCRLFGNKGDENV